MSNSNTSELIAKLKEVLEIDKPLRSLKVEWEQGGPVSVTTETIAVGPAIEQTEGDKLAEMMNNLRRP